MGAEARFRRGGMVMFLTHRCQAKALIMAVKQEKPPLRRNLSACILPEGEATGTFGFAGRRM